MANERGLLRPKEDKRGLQKRPTKEAYYDGKGLRKRPYCSPRDPETRTHSSKLDFNTRAPLILHSRLHFNPLAPLIVVILPLQ